MVADAEELVADDPDAPVLIGKMPRLSGQATAPGEAGLRWGTAA
jgi:hypothetical protein